MEPEIVLQSCVGWRPAFAPPRASIVQRARVAAFLSLSRPTRARSSPPGASRLFIAASCAPRRDDDVSPHDDPHARFRRRRRPRQLPRASPRAGAPSRPHHARARAQKSGRRGATHPARLRPGATFFFFFWVFPALADRARGYPRRAAPYFVSSLPDPLPLRDPSTSPPRARRSSPGLRVAPRRHVRVSPPSAAASSDLYPRLGCAPPEEPSPPPSSSAAPHRHPPRRRSSPPSAPRRFRVQRQVLVQRFDTSQKRFAAAFFAALVTFLLA